VSISVCRHSVKLLPLLIMAWLLATSVATAQTVTVNGISSGSITAAPGDTLTVTVTNGAGNIYDWVGFFHKGATNGFAWWYMSGTHTAPATPLTTVTFPATVPQADGLYEFRYFADPSYLGPAARDQYHDRGGHSSCYCR
jgi:hypothetical protein